MAAKPRCLLATAETRHGVLAFLTYHAPHSKRPLKEAQDFWTDITQLALTATLNHHQLVFMGDANARVGTPISAAVGPLAADEQCPLGALLHKALLELQLILPATFDRWFIGSRHATWTSNLGTAHRIDYVAVPEQWWQAPWQVPWHAMLQFAPPIRTCMWS